MRSCVCLITADGTRLLWHKGGRPHTLDERLGPLWVQNFKPAIFQVLPDGQLVSRGTVGAVDVIAWELTPEGQ
jgi:hypothetical protein